MNKKYIIIKGSNREKGILNGAIKEILPCLKSDCVTVFDAFSENFAPCDGCNYCESCGKCRHRDLDGFFKAFEECDAVIFTSPVYNGTFSAPVKALVDRFQVYYTSFYKNNKTHPVKKHRKGYLIVAAGRDGELAFEYMKSQLGCAFTILNMNLEGSFLIKNTDYTSDFTQAYEDIKKELML